MKLLKLLFNNKPIGAKIDSLAIMSLRVFSGALMVPYGIRKIENYDKFTVNFFEDPIGIGMIPSLWLTIFAQVVCAITLILGLGTRASAAVLTINMAVATVYHIHDGLSVVSLPALFLAIYAYITFVGGGKYSLDNYITKK